MDYTKDNLIQLQGLMSKTAMSGAYDKNTEDKIAIISTLIQVSEKIRAVGYDALLFKSSLKEAAEHTLNVHTGSSGPCYYWQVYEILFMNELRELPLKLHHTFKPLVEWRLKNNI